MNRYQDQGEGELVPGRGIDIIELLESRQSLTGVKLRSGETFAAVRDGWGRDIGEPWEHVYLAADDQIFFLLTSQIAELFDPQSGIVLYQSGDP